jgi:hypothetical protein
MHISNVPQNLAYGFFGEMEYAVIGRPTSRATAASTCRRRSA